MTILISDYQNIGCYNDTDITRTDGGELLAKKPRALSKIYTTQGIVDWPPQAPNSAKMVTDIADARKIAANAGYSVFGIQSGGFLFLGNDINAAVKYGKSTTCAFTPGYINTSGWTNNIWSVALPT